MAGGEGGGGGVEVYDEPTYIGLEEHPHYLMVGGGLADAWFAGDGVSQAGSIFIRGRGEEEGEGEERYILVDYQQEISMHMRPFTRGHVTDWHAMWVLVQHIYSTLSKNSEVLLPSLPSPILLPPLPPPPTPRLPSPSSLILFCTDSTGVLSSPPSCTVG